ncbi:hypothetical protein M8818_007630 [Zalaria obscura]|uniref:Uncharacterized protein n=1 Tax=Zalaria obscura TaxID=2024903 RepID=A0ACC3S7Z0_9PEZI
MGPQRSTKLRDFPTAVAPPKNTVSNWLGSLQQASMPAELPNAATAARRAAAQPLTQEKKPTPALDLGKQTGLFDTPDVRKKVRKWQGEGGGVVEEMDGSPVVVVVDAGNKIPEGGTEAEARQHSPTKSPKPPQPKTSPRSKTSTEIDIEKKAWVRRRSKPKDELEAEIKQASTPKKRVVSDSHWRKDKSTPKRESVAPIVDRKDNKSPAKKEPITPVVDRKDTKSPVKKEPTTPVIDRRDNKSPAKKGPVAPVTDPKPYTIKRTAAAKEPTPPKTAPKPITISRSYANIGFKASTRDEYAKVKIGRRRRRRSSPSPDRAELDDEQASIFIPVPDDSISRRNDPLVQKARGPLQERERQNRLRRRPSEVERDYQRDIKVSPIPTQSTVPPQVFGNRIEAWLGGTPDPFVEGAPQPTTAERPSSSRSQGRASELPLSASDVPAPLNIRTPRSEGRNTPTKAVDPVAKIGTEPSSPLNRPAFIIVEPERPNSAPSTPRLKRSSAKTDLQSSKNLLPKAPFVAHQLHDEEDRASDASSVPPSVIDVPETTFSRHTPGANLRRLFPSTGKRLSTIASVDTLRSRAEPTILSTHSEDEEHSTIVPDRPSPRIAVEPIPETDNEGLPKSSGLRRRLTTHEDLLSVLSFPGGDGKSTVSTRSNRTNRVALETAAVQDLLDELALDEARYQRELRTLVDGVIPVLLTAVLSKSDSVLAAGLFGRTSNSAAAMTQPIVDMGVALERLKGSHKRLPQTDANALCIWAQGASRPYFDYLKAWRMGFQDVVVNLAPADETGGKERWDDGLPRNDQGDLVDKDGERVDVAYLLKRPLVRLKYLARTLKGINQVSPSQQAAAMAEKYQQLVTEARKRSNEERARLEDEAAASIDPTRARDPRSLAPLAGVSVDATRCVRARDYFDLSLLHSSGQQLECKTELILRDDPPGAPGNGDLLVCEVTDTGRWLLFPPFSKDTVSARKGTSSGEIVVMVRGVKDDRSDWQELLSMRATEEEAAGEWVQMLGLLPVPPSLSRKASFLEPSLSLGPNQTPAVGVSKETLERNQTTGTSLPREVEVPIGEQAKPSSKRWSKAASTGSQAWGSNQSTRAPNRLHKKMPSADSILPQEKSKTYSLPNSPLRGSTTPDGFVSDDQRGGTDSSPGLRRAKAKRYKSSPVSPASPRSEYDMEQAPHAGATRPSMHSRSDTAWTGTSSTSSKKDYSVWLPNSTVGSDESDVSEDENEQPVGRAATRPPMARRTSSVPSLDMPTIPKLRRTSEPRTPNRTRGEEPMPASAPAKLQKRPIESDKNEKKDDHLLSPNSRPVTSAYQPKKSAFASFTPAFMKRHRRSSSPLKHEYEPSTATESPSDSGDSDFDDDASITSDSSRSDVETHFAVAKSPPLEGMKSPSFKPTPPESAISLPSNTLSPSQSASQGPYRTVPPQFGKATRTVASIFSWAVTGAWEAMHPEECTIVVTPGLIEAFDISAAHSLPSSAQSDDSSPSARGINPLIALELTPLVPLRRGTALDISVRSPPTSNSIIRNSNNIMFRSRCPEECEHLYGLINYARINNPTYIALQNARGPYSDSSWAAAMDQRNARRSISDSWWHLRSRKGSTYRSSGSRRAPSFAGTESSVGSTNSAFSALRRFSGGSRLFDIAKSTITSTHEGSRSTNSESLSSGSSTPMPTLDPRLGTPLGITDAKIRLYNREMAGKWRDMGSARLTIMIPPRPDPSVPANPRTTGKEKRILVRGKTRGECLLDVTLGESCFERVARTGIAVSVWEEAKGPNGELGQVGAVGGVSSARARVYMIQMKSVS